MTIMIRGIAHATYMIFKYSAIYTIWISLPNIICNKRKNRAGLIIERVSQSMLNFYLLNIISLNKK